MSEFDEAVRARLYLVTPPAFDLDAFAPVLASALQGGDVAAVLIATTDAELTLNAAARLSPMIQEAGAASLIADESRAVGRANADGLHVSTGKDDLKISMERLKPKHIVGAGGIGDRHEAMQVGELAPDYLLFGDFNKPERPGPHPKMVALAGWWTELFEIPAVIMAGASLETLGETLESAAEFIAVRSAVWSYGDGAAAAVARINAALDDDFAVTA